MMRRTTNDGVPIHEFITEERLMEAVESSMFGDDNLGFCLACGEDAESCEPDLEGGYCDACGAKSVFGAEQLMLHTMV